MSNKDFDEKDLMKDIDNLNFDNDKTDTLSEIKNDESTILSSLSDAENTESEDTEHQEHEKKKHLGSKKVYTSKQVALMIIIAVLAVVAIGTVVVCSVARVNPVTYIAGEMNKNNLVNKWQSQSAPGLSAYEFFDDGTYTSYFSTITYDGQYEVKGDQLILKNPNSNQSVIYKYSIVGDTLTLTLANSNGDEMEGSTPNKFDKVDSINQKSFQDVIEQYLSSKEANEESETAAAEENSTGDTTSSTAAADSTSASTSAAQ